MGRAGYGPKFRRGYGLGYGFEVIKMGARDISTADHSRHSEKDTKTEYQRNWTELRLRRFYTTFARSFCTNSAPQMLVGWVRILVVSYRWLEKRCSWHFTGSTKGMYKVTFSWFSHFYDASLPLFPGDFLRKVNHAASQLHSCSETLQRPEKLVVAWFGRNRVCLFVA